VDSLPADVEALTTALHKDFPPLQRVESVDRHSARLEVLKLLPKGGIGAELGVFAGHFSQYLYNVAEPDMFFMVDGWQLVFGDSWPSWGQYNDHGKLTPAMAREAAHRRADLMNGKSQVVISRTVDWLKSLEPNSINWIYSDSGHTYDNTLKELKEISRVLTEDGIVIGDDCQINSAHPHHSVFRAIRDFCRQEDFEIIYMDHARQWGIRRIRT